MEFDVLSIVQMIGGLALFIYGMTTMGKGLERAAGSKLEKTLEKMTGNVFTALIMGMVVTMVIQSSSATTVMVVGFVNAGIMTLKQSVGVILGANIGTTVTAQILRLSGGDGSGNLFMDLLKPKNLAYIIVLVGVIIMMLAKKRRTRDIAAELGARKGSRLLVGFALETHDEQAHAEAKLEKKNFDFIVLNSLRDAGAGFRGDTNKVTFIDRSGREELPLMPKSEVAERIADKIESLLK